jgi:predicted secreted protein
MKMKIWVPSFDRSIINLVSHDFQPSSATCLGSSGNDIFTFQGISHGAYKLKMFYKRRWEEHCIAERIFIINVK